MSTIKSRMLFLILVMSGLFISCLTEDELAIVDFKPVTVETTSATSITTNSAVSGGIISSPQERKVIHGVCWDTNSNPTVVLTTKTTDGTGIGTFSSTLTGLQPATTYYVRAYATSPSSTEYGSERSFKTDSLTIPKLSTTIVTEITTNAASCGGTITYDGGSPITTRGVCWSTTANPTIANYKTANGTGSGPFSSLITELAPGITYYVRAYATNSTGTAYGIQQIFTTSTTFSSITTSIISDITSISAICGGNITSDGGATILSRGVCWSTSINPTTANYTTSDGVWIGSFISNIMGLIPNTTYYVRAYATNSVGTVYGNQVSFTTLSYSTITTTVISSITSNSATCGGNISFDGGTIITSRGVCWALNSSPTINDNKTSDGGGSGAFSSSITGLVSGSKYYVRAYAINSVGISYGNEVSFTTTSLPVLSTSAISSITSSSATSGGVITSNGNASITARGICWSTSANPTISNSKTSDGTDVGTFTSSISGLTANTTYYVKAYATNNVGTAYGSQISFTTSLAPTMPGITSTAISSITTTTALSGGSITSDGNTTITAKGVCWSTSTSPTTANNKTSDGTGNGSFTSTITGLTPTTTYYLRAYATNSVGTSYGIQLSFTTATPPSLPVLTTTAISSITTSTATGGGNITSDGGATVTAKGVCWSTSTSPTTANNKTSDGTGNGSFTSTITGLTPTTTYYLRAYATNSVGTSYGNQVSFTTATPPSLPVLTTTAISSITTTSATGGGNITSDGGATITARGVCWSTTTSPTILNSKTSDGTNTGSYTSSITGLTAGTTYYVRSYATNSAGTAYGTQVSFVTTTSSSTVSDIDGNVYHTIKIGTQTWMVENLKTTKYRDGSSIANVTDNAAWSVLTTGAWCDFENTSANGNKYGHLYNWYAVSDNRKIAPVGWHVPTDAEFQDLSVYVSSHLGTSLSEGIALAATTDWHSTNSYFAYIGYNLIQNNSTGFSGLPGGSRNDNAGTFSNIGLQGNWWSSSNYNSTDAFYGYMFYMGMSFNRGSHFNKVNGFSVRCLKD